MDKTLLLLFSLFSWSELLPDCCKLFLRCIIIDSAGGLSPTTGVSCIVLSSYRMLTDMCCSTTRFTAAADSANNDSCLAELSLKNSFQIKPFTNYTFSLTF